MKCDRCSLQSDVEQAFSMEKHLFRKAKHYCPDCTVKRHSRVFLFEVALLAAGGLLVYALNPSSNITAVVLQANLIVLFFIPLIFIHELTHAAVAKLMSLRVFGIMIGIGKTIWSGKRWDMDWVISILPIGGMTFVGARPVPHIRARLFLIYLAGPASHIFAALGLELLRLMRPWSPLGHEILTAGILANVVLAVLNLFPRTASMATGMQGTDGWHLLRVPSLSDAELTKRYIGYFAAEALQAYSANQLDTAAEWIEKALALDSDSANARNVLGILQMARREYRAARLTFLQVLETADAKEPGLHYILLNNIAYLDALSGDPALLSEADQFSAQAIQHIPWLAPVTGTRGTVLVELGQLEEGITLLKKSMSLHIDKHGKALNACHIAKAELKRGDADAAGKYLRSAKVLDPGCFLLPEVEAQMSESQAKLSNGRAQALPGDLQAL